MKLGGPNRCPCHPGSGSLHIQELVQGLLKIRGEVGFRGSFRGQTARGPGEMFASWWIGECPHTGYSKMVFSQHKGSEFVDTVDLWELHLISSVNDLFSFVDDLFEGLFDSCVCYLGPPGEVNLQLALRPATV